MIFCNLIGNMFKFQKNCSAVRLEGFGTKVSVYMVQYTFLSFYLYWVHFSIFTISFLKASIPCSWQRGSAGKCHVWRHKIRLNPSLFYGFPYPLLLTSFLFRRIFMTSHMTLSVSPAYVLTYNFKFDSVYLGGSFEEVNTTFVQPSILYLNSI